MIMDIASFDGQIDLDQIFTKTILLPSEILILNTDSFLKVN